ncbi:hypothetical protein [Polyangium sp. 6x1]|uniref:hypothetical protein n=1 Tax=Polyangium sp. 6x1 TaxID=3042689 RepID=UPI0024825CEC|nr:hypothetical protein [Polyangium sp. 6x1]MDI1446380.1 hypothetical protein [Polyangium sp. 6x1]
MNITKSIQKAICLATLAVAALYTGVLSADTTAPLSTTTVLNCSATCAGATIGCCASGGKCKYRSSVSVSWRDGEIQNGNCVINGIIVGKMPPEKLEPVEEK